MLKPHSIHNFYILSIFLVSCQLLQPVSATGSKLQLECHKDLISVSADNAEIKNILLKLNAEANIVVKFPDELQKTITIELSDITIERALTKILRGIDHVIVYSMPADTTNAQVSEIHVFGAYENSGYSENPSSTKQSAPHSKQIKNSITSYEKRIQSAQQRINTMPEDSPASKRYQLQIRSYKRIIERLKSQQS